MADNDWGGLRGLIAPNADSVYRAASSVDTALSEYNQAFAALQRYEDAQESKDRDEIWDILASQGKLSGTTAAKALGQLRAAKTARLSAAQMQAQMYRASARQRQAELGQMAKGAMAGDLLNLGTKAVGVGMGMAGAGMLGKAAGAATAIPGMVGPASPAQTATANAGRYSPMLAGIGEALSGVGGGQFTAQAVAGRYPELGGQPQVDALKRYKANPASTMEWPEMMEGEDMAAYMKRVLGGQ